MAHAAARSACASNHIRALQNPLGPASSNGSITTGWDPYYSGILPSTIRVEYSTTRTAVQYQACLRWLHRRPCSHVQTHWRVQLSVASPWWVSNKSHKGSSCRRNAKLICNGHGVCGTYVPRHYSPIVVWTHSNDRVAIHTHVGYEMGRYTS